MRDITNKLIMVLVLGALFCGMKCQAQSLQDYATRLQTFGEKIPQEKVFVHMDNTSYYIGDTVYYKAYNMLSNGKPSNVSGLLYVELLNHDGYLVERQNIKLVNGQGHGSFVLLDSLYGGYYELRAYTRWQLNWGVTEHPHTEYAEKWFYSKRMAKEYYRDYDKLYSRVFPVYDKPKEAGNYEPNMTLRPLRRYFKTKYEKPKADLSFFPEGGCLIAGTNCRVAFEANDTDGKHLKGKLTVKDKKGNVVAEANTESRGRGSFVLAVKEEEKYTAEFVWNDNNSDTEKLPAIVKEGTALQATIQGDAIHLSLENAGQASQDELGVTVTNNGMLCDFQTLGTGNKLNCDIPLSKLPMGVAQITVFNAQGRIYADRLVFVKKEDVSQQNVKFSGLTSSPAKAFEKVNFSVQGPEDGTISLAVRDATMSEYTFDSGNIMTEMLLSSQIKGFVEQPEYFFEKNDEEHSRALDLLLMVQGWRRYNWVEMAIPKNFALDQPYEKTQWIYGSVHKYEPLEQQDFFSDAAKLGLDEAGMSADYEAASAEYPNYMSTELVRKWKGLGKARVAASILEQLKPDTYDASSYDPLDVTIEQQVMREYAQQLDATREGTREKMSGTMAAERFNENQGTLKNEVTVHAEFTLAGQVVNGGEKAAEGEMLTYNKGLFRIEAPAYDGYCYFFCGASNQEKWKQGKEHIWIAPAEVKEDQFGNGDINYPEYYVRFNFPYPRFVKPYSFYQASQNLSPRKSFGKLTKVDDATLMHEVTIGAKRSGLSAFDASKPAIVLEAYEAFNATCDAGLCTGYFAGQANFVTNVARTYIGDMNMYRAYDIEMRYNSKNSSHSFSPGVLNKYNHLHNLDKVYIYTDYAPRREGDKRFSQSNQPMVTVDLRIPEDDSRFVTYRDRRAVLWGFSVCEDFYSPDYSTKPLPSTKDYRRTLYWNPDLKLDAEGKANVEFYNNNKQTQFTVSAEGVGSNGTLMTGMSYPEERE